MTNFDEMNSSQVKDEDFNYLGLLKLIWNSRKLIFWVVSLFIFFGFFYAVLSKNYYSASVTIVPVTAGGDGVKGNLGGLASLAGINLGGVGSVSGEISPELYPEIVSSLQFKLELLNTKIKVKESDSLVSYKYYYQELHSPGFLSTLRKYTIGLPSLLVDFIKEPSNQKIKKENSLLLKLSKDEYKLIKNLENQISIEVNDKEGFVSLSFVMPEPQAAAQMTLRAQQLLQEYAIRFKTQKSKEQLVYIEDRFVEKQKEFDTKKLNLAIFQDQNRNINSAVARTKLLQLESEYNLAFTIYTEVAKQLETQRLQVKKDTPIFTIVNPVTIPPKKSGPKRSLILIGFAFLGLIVSLGYIYFKSLLPDLKKEWERV